MVARISSAPPSTPNGVRHVPPMLLAAAVAACGTGRAGRAVSTLCANQVEWGESGRVRAECHESIVTGGVNGNYWPRLTPEGAASAGQTFRCPGPRLTGVQLGLDDVDTGYKGLNWRPKPCPVTIRLHRDGPGGEIVAERTFRADQPRHDLPLPVDAETGAGQHWYVEVVPDFPDGFRSELFLNANRHNTYADGRLHVNGQPATADAEGRPLDGDLLVRVTRSWTVEAVRSRPVVLWVTRPESRIWMEPDRTAGQMLEDDPARPFRMSAVRNERVSCQVVATPWPAHRIRKAALALDPIHGPNGTGIDAANVRIEWLRYSLDFKRGKTSRRLYPDPLAPTATATAVAGEPDAPLNRAFWLSVRVPEACPPGLYRTVARVTVNDDVTLARDVEFEVVDLTLPRGTYTRTGLFRQNGGSLERHLWWTRDLAEFRIAMGSPFPVQLLGRQRSDAFGEASYAYILSKDMQSALVAFGKLVNELGLHMTHVSPWGDTYRMFRGEEGGREGIVRFWETYYPLLRDNGWVEEAYCRIPDELKGDQLPRAKEIAALFRKHAPGVPILVTSMGTPKPEELSKAIGIADIWCQDSRYMPLAMDFYRQRMDEGEEVWPYIHDFTWHGADPAALRLFFWMLEKHGFGGACYFCIKRATFKPAWYGVERHSDTWPGDGDLYYDPGVPSANVNGVWRSARLYRIGDGIEDRELFRLMRSLAAEARGQGRLSGELARRVAEAERGLNAAIVGMLNVTTDMAWAERVRCDAVAVTRDLRRVVR